MECFVCVNYSYVTVERNSIIKSVGKFSLVSPERDISIAAFQMICSKQCNAGPFVETGLRQIGCVKSSDSAVIYEIVDERHGNVHHVDMNQTTLG